jgi:GxxExxY protein
MRENELATIVLDISFEVHRTLGPGLFESVYEEILVRELESKYNLHVERQKAIPVYWKGERIDFGFRPDLIIENTLIVEIKSIEQIAKVHYKQVQTYLKLTDIKLGLLLNFNEDLLKNGIKRIANNL